ncbi:MAG: Na+/H+ antiporter NhaC family protein [Planctomycetota bacterium]
MNRRLRVITAAAFAVLFFLIPSPDTTSGRAYLGTLKVREWLLDQDGPLNDYVEAGTIPPLAVQYVVSPADPAVSEVQARECVRAAAEWAAARTIESGTEAGKRAVDPSRPPVALTIRAGDDGVSATLGAELVEWAYPSRGSLIPAFLAIILAIATQRIVMSLFAGSLAGAAWFLATGSGAAGAEVAFSDALLSPLSGLWHLLTDTLWTDILGEPHTWLGLGETEPVWTSSSGFQARIIVFVVFLFMAIGVMSKSGGIQGMVQWISRFARGPVSTQLCTWFTGLLIFFDDYSNCIIAGTTMQPLGDRNGVSREKIAYIVDSTAAPIAGLSIFSTWIAYEITQYRAPLTLVTNEAGAPYLASDAFAVFVQTIPYRFYCIFALLLIALSVLMRRDFGPMLKAEVRARQEGKPLADDAKPMVGGEIAAMQPPPGAPRRARNGFLPVGVLIAVTLYLIYYYGAYDSNGDYAVPAALEGLLERSRWILGQSSTEKALMWSALWALVTAAALALGQRILSPRAVLASAVRSAKSLGIAIVILMLAWCIGQTCKDLGTAFYLTAAFRDLMSAAVLPILMFLLAGLIAFATGTSYGTMAILLPNVVVLSHTIGAESSFGGPALMILTIGSVLEGSIFGDHCSPISDTTVLSSLGTRCDHLHHVQTQIPYAMLAMGTATLCGYLPMVTLGPSWWWLSMLLGPAALVGFLLVFGRDAGKVSALPASR